MGGGGDTVKVEDGRTHHHIPGFSVLGLEIGAAERGIEKGRVPGRMLLVLGQRFEFASVGRGHGRLDQSANLFLILLQTSKRGRVPRKDKKEWSHSVHSRR